MSATLAAASLADLAVATLFASVGRTLSQREVTPRTKRASQAFQTWWYGIAAVWTLDGLRGLALSQGTPPLVEAAFLYAHYATVAALCAALWGLLVYLTFLFRGTTRHAAYAAFYIGFFATATAAISWAQPATIHATPWTTAVAYAHPLPRFIEAAFFLALLAPQLVGASAYATLVGKVASAHQKYRVLVVSTSLLVWISANLAAALLQMDTATGWQITRRILALTAALAIVAAYHPPRLVRDRLDAHDARTGASATDPDLEEKDDPPHAQSARGFRRAASGD